MGRRRTGQRAGLDRARVLAAARQVVADDGIEGLSMRAVARHLEVAPNALYSWVDSKDALVDLLLDDVLVDVRLEQASSRPLDDLHTLLVSTYDALLAHAALLPALLARQGARGPHAQRLGRIAHDLLTAAGLTETAAEEALHVVLIYTMGFAAFARHPSIDVDGGPGHGLDETRTDFTTGLDWLLAGVTSDPRPKARTPANR